MSSFATTSLFSAVTPAASGAGGQALNANFALLDRLLWSPYGIQSTTTSTSIGVATRIMLVDDTSTNLTENLPAIATAYQPVRVMKTNASAYGVTVNTTDATINGTTSVTISSQWQYIDFYPSTAAWYAFGQ